MSNLALNTLRKTVKNYILWFPHGIYLLIKKLTNGLNNNYLRIDSRYRNKNNIFAHIYKNPFGKLILVVMLSIKWVLSRITYYIYIVLRITYLKIWVFSQTRRHLLLKSPRPSNFKESINHLFLRSLFAIADLRYKYSFKQYSKVLKTIHHPPKSKYGVDIIYMIGSLGPGGSEKQLLLTLEGIANKQYKDIKLFCLYLRNSTEMFNIEKVKSYSIPVSEMSEESEPDDQDSKDFLNYCVKQLPSTIQYQIYDYFKVLVKYQPSIVHLWLDEINIKGGIAAVSLGIPKIILSLRSFPPIYFGFHQPFMREAYRWLSKQKGVILVNNSFAGAQAYEQWLNLPTGTIQVLHNGFDFQRYDPIIQMPNNISIRTQYNIPDNAPLIGTVIRFSVEKRVDYWLRIAEKIYQQSPDVHFLLVGDGPLFEVANKQVEGLGIKNNVHFAGHIKETLPMIAEMDIFLLTSRIEGLPNVLIEAQAVGVPVVTTNAGGAPETLQHAVTGWVLEYENDKYAADAIVKLLGDKTWLQQAEKKAPVFVKEKFDLNKMIKSTISIYES